MSVARWKVGRKKMSHIDKIKELEEEVYNTEQSIEELKKHA